MNIGEVFEISDGNGGTVQVRIVDRLRNENGRLLQKVSYVQRKRNKGRWGKIQESTIAALRKLKI